MNIKENDVNQEVREYLSSKGCPIIKQDTRQGSLIADMIGCIVNEQEELENKVLVEIKSKSSPTAQKQLFSMAKKLNIPYSLLVIIQDEGPKYYWFESESGLPVTEQTFESISKHIISETDIEEIIGNAFDLMRAMVIGSDEAWKIILYLLLVRSYLYEHSQVDRWNSLNEEEIKFLISKASSYYKVLEYDITRFMLGDRLKNLLFILSNLPIKSKQYQNIAASVAQKVMGRESGMSSTPINLLSIIGRLTKYLNINYGKVMNLGSGMGSLLREIRENTSADLYEGVDLNVNVIFQSIIINIISGYDDINIKNIDAFQISNDEEYKLIEINPPIGMKVRKEILGEGLTLSKTRGMINISEAFLEKAINIAIPGGYIISIVQDGSLFSGVSQPIREIINERTIVKAIISLPEHIFKPFATIKSSILILEKKNKNILTTPKSLFIGKIDSLDDTDEVLEGFQKWLIEEENYADSKKI